MVRRTLVRVAAAALPDFARGPQRVQRVLVIQPDHLGDVILASPALARLQEAAPEVDFSYLVGPWSAEVAAHGPLADAVSTLPFPGFSREPKPNPLQPYALLWRTARDLRRKAYDAAIVVRPDHWWGALLARVARIPIRIGFETPDTRPLLTHALAWDRRQHATARGIALADHASIILGGSRSSSTTSETVPQFRLSAADEDRAKTFLRSTGLEDGSFVVLHPSAGVPLKSWPVERWAAIAERLAESGWPVVLSGGPGDDSLLAAVQERMAIPPAGVLVGQPLGVFAAILALAAVVAGPDNGPLHLAATVGTATVRLYGPASPEIFGPWPAAERQRVLHDRTLACVPCGQLVDPPCGATVTPACMRALSTDRVLTAIREIAVRS